MNRFFFFLEDVGLEAGVNRGADAASIEEVAFGFGTASNCRVGTAGGTADKGAVSTAGATGAERSAMGGDMVL